MSIRAIHKLLSQEDLIEERHQKEQQNSRRCYLQHRHNQMRSLIPPSSKSL